MSKKKLVELKDKATSFHDFETGFDIVRDQRKDLGENVGRATTVAIQRGRLIEVRVPEGREPKVDANTASGQIGKTAARLDSALKQK